MAVLATVCTLPNSRDLISENRVVLPAAAPTDWTVYGFGTPAWSELFKTAAQAHKDNDLIMDFALGPNQGQGVPAEVGSDGLAWDLVSFNFSIPIGSSFNGTLPGWGTLNVGDFWKLESVTIGLLLSTHNETSIINSLGTPTAVTSTYNVLAASSLKNITELAGADGTLDYTFPTNVTGIEYNLFAVSMCPAV